jgi:hypothetical protein
VTVGVASSRRSRATVLQDQPEPAR